MTEVETQDTERSSKALLAKYITYLSGSEYEYVGSELSMANTEVTYHHPELEYYDIYITRKEIAWIKGMSQRINEAYQYLFGYSQSFHEDVAIIFNRELPARFQTEAVLRIIYTSLYIHILESETTELEELKRWRNNITRFIFENIMGDYHLLYRPHSTNSKAKTSSIYEERFFIKAMLVADLATEHARLPSESIQRYHDLVNKRRFGKYSLRSNRRYRWHRKVSKSKGSRVIQPSADIQRILDTLISSMKGTID